MNHKELFQEKVREDRRLVILRFLAEEPDYRMNTSLLRDALEIMGHRVSRDQVHTDGAWLEENALIIAESVGSVTLFKLTERGQDAASGAIRVPGVKRPSPKNL